VRIGAHLPLIDFGAGPPSAALLRDYVDAARDGGFAAVSANDHLVYQRPWLDGIVALASVLERTGGLTVATTVSLPVIRGPVALAKAAVALNALSGGRLALGVGPGSSAADYAAVGLPFDQRWRLFDHALGVLRTELADADVPIWIGSWGSPTGLRRVARAGDGWLASAYNTTPARLVEGRKALAILLEAAGRDPEDFPVALATAWTYVTDDPAEARAKLDMVAKMLGRDPDLIAQQVLIGSPERCRSLVNTYAEAGVGTLFIWPVGDPVGQLRRFGEQVAASAITSST
jgi:alkanesulfonate monooxygenase SsuD/methylene tetrahydromethanopterin reductase-like flavin-dependent oxidoreductase (luciferase family)